MAVLRDYPAGLDPRLTDVIGRVADKWTMMVLDVLSEHGELRFSKLAHLATGISQKMLTQTVRQLERDGLVIRTIHPVIPPKVEYRLTDLGVSLAEAFRGVWVWAAHNVDRIAASRRHYDTRSGD
ncbi:helix-turn-helix domain-containing protein [Sphingomonas sp.]|uniref:winged helix-turn-helix transcriptional regulator n=1 Tax=Sphingomonas sp. TaxID=28214 RepID=UPI003340514C